MEHRTTAGQQVNRRAPLQGIRLHGPAIQRRHDIQRVLHCIRGLRRHRSESPRRRQKTSKCSILSHRLTFRDRLHFAVGRSSPSHSSTGGFMPLLGLYLVG